MNRAILIVICDFLVSAMLSMMTGMVPAHTGGSGVGLDERTTRLLLGELELRQRELDNLRRQLREAAAKIGKDPDNDARVRRVTAEIVDNIRRMEALKRAERATAANTGVLTPKQLEQALESEVRKRLELEIKLRDQKLDSRTASEKLELTRDVLKRERQRLKTAETKLEETSKAERSANKELRRLADDYRKVQEKLGDTNAKRRLSERELAAARSAIAARDADLAGVKNALREMNRRIGQVSLARQELQRTLAFTTGKLNTAERDNADYKGQLAKLRKDAAKQKIELAESLNARKQMEILVKRSLKELSQAKQEAEKNKHAAITAAARLNATEKLLNQVTARSANEAFRRYAKSAVKLNFAITEERMMLNRSLKKTYYPVLVKFGSKVLAVGAFDLFTGSPDVAMLYRNITSLSYSAETPDEKINRKINTPMLALKSTKGDRLAAFEISLPGREPLLPVTREQLLQRGTEDLFLFNCNEFGRESTSLSTRCSIDPKADSPYLFIRNSKARSGTQLKASLGDLVITREGGFVGVVTGFVSGENSDARVLLFSDAAAWDKATDIPISTASGVMNYEHFGSAVRNFKAEGQNRQQLRRKR